MKSILFTILILLSGHCFGQISKDSNSTLVPFHEFNISLVKLITNPEKYDGKIIQIVGYLNLEFEGDAIYLHKEDYDHSITRNAFSVRFSKEIQLRNLKKYNKAYVIIVGKFDMKNLGHMSLFGGTIKDITRLDLWRIRNRKP